MGSGAMKGRTFAPGLGTDADCGASVSRVGERRRLVAAARGPAGAEAPARGGGEGRRRPAVAPKPRAPGQTYVTTTAGGTGARNVE
ncbi:unnamed protein product, partial [Iphiclides podalirius]